MATRINLSPKLLENLDNIDTVNIISYTIMGYTIDSKNGVNIVNFFYMMESDDHKVYMIKNSFLLSKDNLEAELKYYNSALHLSQNLNLDVARERNDIIARQINGNFTRFSDSTYYMDFGVNNITDNYQMYMYGLKIESYKSSALKVDSSNVSIVNFKIPFNIYLRLASIRTAILFKFPLFTTIEEDTRWDHYNLYNSCKLAYLGSYKVSNDQLLAYYSLHTVTKHIGFVQALSNIKEKIVTKVMTNDQFLGLFGRDGFFLSDPSKSLIIDWKVNDEIKPRVAVCRASKNNKKMNVYIIDQDIEDSSILNPYKEIYK